MRNRNTTLSDIAGYCPEEAVWKILLDISTFRDKMTESPDTAISPAAISVVGDSFLVARQEEADTRFLAPEQAADAPFSPASWVWTCGALAYYASTGQVVFGGRGGIYQQTFPQAPLPVLPKAHKRLTPLVQRCLCHDPAERPSPEELLQLATEGYNNCRDEQQEPAPETSLTPTLEAPASGWPETMTAS